MDWRNATNTLLDWLAQNLTRPTIQRYVRHWLFVIFGALGWAVDGPDTALFSAAIAAAVSTYLSSRNEKKVVTTTRVETIRNMNASHTPGGEG